MSDKIERGSYGQFCPVAMAAEVVCSRWTALVVRELLCGTRRFNDLRRGVPLMSPTLLSKRLKELEEVGRDRHHPDRTAGRRRVPADGGRRGPAAGRHVARHLGTAVGRIFLFA